MIYEVAYVLRTEANDDAVKKMAELVKTTIAQFEGEVLVEDAWGVKSFAQATQNGVTRGNYFYFMYAANTQVNQELERRFRISEDILKFLVVKLGTDDEKTEVVKAYRNPAQAQAMAQGEHEKDRKMFSKRKSCWFSAKKTSPDWKDMSSYSWLVNEFGKISPARVTGLRPKFQRQATAAIKRARCMGFISFTSNQTAR